MLPCFPLLSRKDMSRELQQATRVFKFNERRADILWDVLLGISVVVTIMVRFESPPSWFVWVLTIVLISALIIYRMYHKAIKKSREAYVVISTHRGDRSPRPFIAEFFRWKDLLLIIPPAFTGHLYYIDTVVVVGVLWYVRSEERRYINRMVKLDE